MRRRRGRVRGFTLVELIASMCIIAMIATLGSGLVWQGAAACRGAATAPQVHAEGAAALERLVREWRGIELRPGSSPAAPSIQSIGAASMTWNSADSLALRGSDLMLTEDGGTARVLLRGVTSLAVRAYDESGAEVLPPVAGEACDAVRTLSVELTVSREGISDTLRTRVFIRSLMTGASP
jgi:prepilin-type N-terminal cleavage/methylation domain-containing protein